MEKGRENTEKKNMKKETTNEKPKQTTQRKRKQKTQRNREKKKAKKRGSVTWRLNKQKI